MKNKMNTSVKRVFEGKKRGIAVGAAVLLSLLLTLALSFSCLAEAKYGGIYQKTIRLHVLADSDEPQAQELKLEVRDALLALLEEEMNDCADKEQAETALRDLLPALEARAESTLEERGCPLPVTLSLEKENYPLRVYESCTFPAGEYLSLRVFIGSGNGKNWWCVVYPPLCLSSSLADKGGYTEDEQALLTGNTGGYKLKFAFLELGQRLLRLFEG